MNRTKRILLVEESKTIRLHLENIITPLGYETINATTLEETETLTNKNKTIYIALVALDTDGVELIVDFLIKKGIAIILLCGVESPQLREEFIKKDIVDYIEKITATNSHEIIKLIERLETNAKETILVVDDASLFRRLISNILKKHKFKVIEAKDGLMALDILKKNKHINLIITDYEMPYLDGLGLVKEVRKEYDLKSLPIIVISSLNSQSTIVQCMKNGANDYLLKPFSNGELYSRIYLTLSYKENLDLLAEQKKAYEMLSHSLEERVQDEVMKNKQQASHMLQQSRLAQMGEMISMIAHQWRQPLASISAISGTLTLDIMMDEYKADFFQERLESISELAQHLSSTIDDFRGFFQDNKETQNTKLQNIIDESLQIIGPTIATKNIKLQLDLDNEISLNTYANEVKQVVLNILKNAEDILLEKKISNASICIKAYSDENGHACLSIEDNAGGIPNDIIDRVFDPYFSTKTTKDGTGLGLYMSKTIIEEHCRGKLTVSNSENGAKFIISLPKEVK
jgi:signal transduction histidine kinase